MKEQIENEIKKLEDIRKDIYHYETLQRIFEKNEDSISIQVHSSEEMYVGELSDSLKGKIIPYLKSLLKEERKRLKSLSKTQAT